jgi:hypothetical protein
MACHHERGSFRADTTQDAVRQIPRPVLDLPRPFLVTEGTHESAGPPPVSLPRHPAEPAEAGLLPGARAAVPAAAVHARSAADARHGWLLPLLAG